MIRINTTIAMMYTYSGIRRFFLMFGDIVAIIVTSLLTSSTESESLLEGRSLLSKVGRGPHHLSSCVLLKDIGIFVRPHVHRS